jgi:hypothetical protein
MPLTISWPEIEIPVRKGSSLAGLSRLEVSCHSTQSQRRGLRVFRKSLHPRPTLRRLGDREALFRKALHTRIK